MNETRTYTDVFGRTYEDDFDDIIRREAEMNVISNISALEREIYDKIYSSHNDE